MFQKNWTKEDEQKGINEINKILKCFKGGEFCGIEKRKKLKKQNKRPKRKRWELKRYKT